jgi:hypothetical protein
MEKVESWNEDAKDETEFLLGPIGDEQRIDKTTEDAAFDFTRTACASFGPFKACAEIVAGPAVKLEFFLAGIKIGSGTITAAHNKVCVSANVGLAKVSVCARGDFEKKEIWLEGKVCVRKFPSGWSCRSFKTRLLSW